MSTRKIVLGVHCGHDAAACIMIDGVVVADAQEERFTRQKHCSGIPYYSVQFCIDQAGIASHEIDAVATSHRHFKLEHFFLFPGLETPPIKPTKRGIRQTLLGNKSELHYPEFVHVPGKIQGNVQTFHEGPLQSPDYLNQVHTKAGCEFLRFGHHECHAASAYFTSTHLSNGRDTLVLVFDGIGDDISTSVWKGLNGRLQLLKSYGREFSLGFFYSTVTEVLGYQVLDGEGTTMGLAPYGKHVPEIERVLQAYFPDLISESEPENKVGTVYRYDIAGTPHFHLSRVNALSDKLLAFEKADIAFVAQEMLEKAVCAFAHHWMKLTGIDRICLSGGVALNVKMNSALVESGIGKLEVFPNPGDGGLALGNALLANQKLSKTTPHALLQDLYWGPETNDLEIEEYLRSRKIDFSKPENIYQATAQVLADNKAVGWYQGRMESGPRALGNRSILMNPSVGAHKDYLNEQVKYRQGFRPFCPSILEGHENELLENYDGGGRHMIRSYRVTDQGHQVMPAAVHADGTTRPQVVGLENHEFRKLLEAFYDLTKIPVLINTSLNVKGEPIASTHVDAIKCFFSSGLDALVLGSFLLKK